MKVDKSKGTIPKIIGYYWQINCDDNHNNKFLFISFVNINFIYYFSICSTSAGWTVSQSQTNRSNLINNFDLIIQSFLLSYVFGEGQTR